MATPINFESSWEKAQEKSVERQQLREARDRILSKAKHDYEKAERRKEAAIERGERTWMLPCVSERIDTEQLELAKVKKKKPKKDKKHKKHTKEKKEKKKHNKHSHRRTDGDSSDSDSDGDASWVEKPAVAPSDDKKGEIPCASRSDIVKGPVLERDSWMSSPLDMLPCVSRDDIRSKKMEKTELEKAKLKQQEEMGKNKRELNPYWRDGGMGLPQQDNEETGKKSVATVTGDAGVGWLRKAYKRCEQAANDEGRTLDEVAAERYGSLSKLKKMLRDAEKSFERLKEEEREERYGKRDNSRRGRGEDHGDGRRDRGSNRDREDRDRVRSRDRERTPPRDSDRYVGKDSDRAGNRENRCDTGRRRFMKPGNDDERDPSHSHPHREDPPKPRRGFMKPSEAADTRREPETSKSRRDSTREKASFKRPDNDEVDATYRLRRDKLKTRSRSDAPRWKKETRPETKGNSSGSSDSGSSQSESSSGDEEKGGKGSSFQAPPASLAPPTPHKLLSETEMNRLGANVLRAEMMGNESLAADLKRQLDEARNLKSSAGQLPQVGIASRPGDQDGSREGEEVVLTRTDRSGMVRPLPTREYPDETQGGKRRKKQKVKTHADQGERERYFDDDDAYSLKALVEREKLGTAEDQNTMFARLAGRSVGVTNDDYQLDDVFVDRASRQQSQSHVESRERQLAIIEHKKMAASLDNCPYCFEKVPKHLIISIGKKVYLCLPNYRSMTEGHCLIVPMMHVTQATALDEDVWDEIQVFRKALTRMYGEEDEDCVFIELCTRLKKTPHMVIECVPMPREVGDMAPIYFKKAMMESDTEWTENQKVVDLSQKDIRKAVPKGFPYFAVDFGLQGGFAHIIEDENHFPHYFGREIVGGMLDLEPTMWRKHQRENFDDQRKKVIAFAEKWKPHDWTQSLNTASTDD